MSMKVPEKGPIQWSQGQEEKQVKPKKRRETISEKKVAEALYHLPAEEAIHAKPLPAIKQKIKMASKRMADKRVASEKSTVEITPKKLRDAKQELSQIGKQLEKKREAAEKKRAKLAKNMLAATEKFMASPLDQREKTNAKLTAITRQFNEAHTERLEADKQTKEYKASKTLWQHALDSYVSHQPVGLISEDPKVQELLEIRSNLQLIKDLSTEKLRAVPATGGMEKREIWQREMQANEEDLRLVNNLLAEDPQEPELLEMRRQLEWMKEQLLERLAAVPKVEATQSHDSLRNEIQDCEEDLRLVNNLLNDHLRELAQDALQEISLLKKAI
jgi:hypothetical protein